MPGRLGALRAARRARGDLAPRSCGERRARGRRAVEAAARPGRRRRSRRRPRGPADRGGARLAGHAGRGSRALGADRASGPARRARRGRGEWQPRLGRLPRGPARDQGCSRSSRGAPSRVERKRRRGRFERPDRAGGGAGGSWLRRRRGRPPGPTAEDERCRPRPEARRGSRQLEPPPPPPPPKAIWTDSHCHLQDDPDPAATLAPRARLGSGGWSASGPTPSRPAPGREPGRASCRQHAAPSAGPTQPRRHRQPLGRRRAELWATVGLHPHDAKVGPGLGDRAPRRAVGRRGLAPLAGRRHRRVRARLPLRPLAARRSSVTSSPPRSLWRIATTSPLVIHTREAWDDTFSVLEPRAFPSGRSSTASRAASRRPSGACDIGAYLSFSGIVTFANAERAAPGRRPLPARQPADRDRLALPHAGAPSRASQRPEQRRPRRATPSRR